MSQTYASQGSRQGDATYERGQSQRLDRRTQQHEQVGRRYPTRNYLSEEVRNGGIAALNQCLADTVVLRSQLQFAHWNVKGPNFYQLHELFDELAELFEDHIDTIAERAAALGGQALGTARMASQASTMPALSARETDELAMVEQLADNLAALDATLYQEITAANQRNDLDTADLLNEVSRDVSKALGFLEAHLQGRPMATAGSGSPPARGPPTQ